VPLACCAIALGGCDRHPAAPQAPPPPAGFNVAAVDSAVATVSALFGTPAVRSLTALSALLVPAAASIALRAAVPTAACAPVAGRAIPVIPVASRNPAGLIADSLFRRVFVYDTAAHAYRAGTDTSGPPSGIRFVLYNVSSYGLPVVPLSPDGWLDLTDQSVGTALQLRSQISNGSTTFADYLVRLSGTRAADTALLGGTVTDGSHTLAFRDSTALAGFTVAVSAHMSDSLDGFTLDMLASRVSFDPFDYNDNLDFTFTDSAQTIRLVGAIRTYCLLPSIGLTVSVNGTEYATITNGTTTPNVTLAGGQPAATEASLALLGMKDAQQQLFTEFGALFAPAKALLP
jgi:hypothetical protein